MAIMVKRWYRSRRNAVIVCGVAAVCVLYYISLQLSVERLPDLDITRRAAIIEYIEDKLQEALKQDKGMGCEVPQLDPFAKEIAKFNKKIPNIKCNGQDWVKCYHSKCRVVDSIRDKYTDISCTYRDILYHSDQKYTIGTPRRVDGGDYELKDSDHVKVACVGKGRDGKKAEWSGITLGFRPTSPPAPPAGRENTYNVLIFGFDSTARNGFIRNMPKTWKTLKNIGATVLEGYNIVGDGTPAALFPILTGKTELELPDVRKSKRNNGSLDSFPFVFYKLKEDGYRTAYFEDMPHIGTFQYRFNGWRHQPADHYLRAFYLEIREDTPRYWNKNNYCVGDTPQFKLMINITQQFLELGGKRYIFTFIADITHDDTMLQVADDDTSAFLAGLMEKAEDTLIIAMSDHGPRFAKVRDTLQGKLEERLPLMAIRLPSRLVRSRPHAQRALAANARALTTPHDVFATIMDVLDWREHWNPYRVRGADLPRGMTMLEPIPRNRSCSEAGIEPHWCSCLNWKNVSVEDPFYSRAAEALVHFINTLVAEVGELCRPRTLTSIEWVLRQHANDRLLAFAHARDADGYVGAFNADTRATSENYQAKIVVGPGRGVYEASMTYVVKDDKFVINTRDISRTNAYRDEPACISHTHPHLNPYCYCR